MFAISTQKLADNTDTIWKFQRYGLVIDFEVRTALPPPLNIFYYCWWAITWTYRALQYRPFKKDTFKFKDLFLSSEVKSQSKPLADDDYTYLKLLADQVYDAHHSHTSAETLAMLQWERIKWFGQELEANKRMMRQLHGKQAEMERSLKLLVSKTK
ncbi:unnamed protein product [Medioppia subpectinata]|uniref:Uncharacterized protein n=2 Tax=Medioppia subpectinata TaxID=1979941 RepID=A0A7R9L9Q4_9ACAR|nr:unnamed protein product [Medioppia subpectinata]CAG2116752.1 unnamed protein product [Medioppia subpectinata]